jgi:Protein of unknown function (DUF3761)
MLRKLLLAAALTLGAPSLVTAQTAVTCKDGTPGTAGRGACSHHGGVAKGVAAPSAPPAAAPPPLAPAPSAAPSTRAPARSRATTAPVAGQPTARCKDGSVSYSLHHSGSCSHHGGVSQWLQ